jgi:hypothetical protein
VSRRLKLRPAVHCAPVRDGVHFAAWTESFTVHGPASLFRLVEAVLPLLEEAVPEDELLARLPEGPARAVTAKLLAELLDRRMLLDLDALTVSALPAELWAAYGDTIAHLEGTSDDPYAAFLRFRAARVAVLGDTEAAQRCAGLLAALGLAEPVGYGLDRDAVDLVVDLATVAEANRYGSVADAALRLRVPLVQGLASGTAGVLCGPRTGDAQPSLADVLARCDLRRAAGFAAPELAGEPTPVLNALVADLAAHRAFQWLTGTSPERTRVALADADTLAVTEHAVLPVTGSPDGADLDLAGVTVEAFLDRARELSDEAFGVLGPASPWGLPQTPAFATAVRVDATVEAYGFGLSEEESRFRAYVEALRALAGDGAAVGLDHPGLLVDGVARRALRAWADGPFGDEVTFAGTTDDVARMCWKTLALRFGREIDVVTCEPLAGITLVAVREGGSVLAAAYGTTPVRALRDALVTALGLVQTERPGPYLAGWVDGPPVLGVADDDPPKPVEVLDRLGLDVATTPVDHPAVAAAGALAARVEVRRG